MTDESQPTWQQLLDLVTQLNDGDYENVAVSFGGVSIRLSKNGVFEPDASAAASAPAIAVPGAPSTGAVQAVEHESTTAHPTGEAITAPMLGVFYRRPSPGAAPFVEPGESVDADTTIGIIEIMKLMNPVVAGMAGVISAFEVGDGESVQFGQTLARLDQTAK